MKTAIVVTDEKANERVPDPDVIVFVQKGHKIINATGGALKGLSSALGQGVLGQMTLGGK